MRGLLFEVKLWSVWIDLRIHFVLAAVLLSSDIC